VQIIFPVIFILIWSTAVLCLDGVAAYNIFKQFESSHYSVAAGRVTHSETRSHRGSKGGTSYKAVIQYRFEVGGQSFAGARLRYNDVSPGFASATRMVAAYPEGAAVQVFYSPKNPQDMLLLPGINGSDLVVVLFLTPFNAVMVGFWAWGSGWLRDRLYKPAAGGMKIITDGMLTRVRLPQYGAALCGLATVGGLGFVSIFIVMFSTQMEPSIRFALTVIGLVYLAGAGAYLWQWRKIRSGVDDLVINASARTLELPQTFGRKQRVTAGISDIESLMVKKIEHRSSKGGISYTHAPTLRLRGPQPSEQKLADWSDKVRADDFAAWLRQQLGL
jgi:hypothetical protein